MFVTGAQSIFLYPLNSGIHMKTKSIPFRMNAIASVSAFALMAACSLAGAGTLSGATTTLNGVNVVTNPPKITTPNQIVQVKHYFGVAYYGPDKSPNVTCWAKLTYSDGGEPPEMLPVKFPMDGVSRMRQYTKPGKYTANLMGVAHNGKPACLGDVTASMTIENGIAPAVGVIGSPARLGANSHMALTPATPARGVSATPGLTVAPDKITGVVASSTKLEVGTVLTLKQTGTGNANAPACGSEVYLTRVAAPGAPQLPDGFKLASQSLNQWPKTQTYLMTLPGLYEVHLRMAVPAPTCGYNGPGSIPGDLTKIEVTPTVVAK